MSGSGKAVQIADLQDAHHSSKKMDGFPVRLHMVSAVWNDTSLNELLLLTEASDTCLKLSFDPALASIQTRLHVGSRKDGHVRMIRTITRPMLLGLISAREVDSVVRDPAPLPDGSIIGGALGLQSPLLLKKIEQSQALQSLASQPPSSGKTRAIDHTSALAARVLAVVPCHLMNRSQGGYIFEPMDAGSTRQAILCK